MDAFRPTTSRTDEPAVDAAGLMLPILESGDRLTRCEFERRYACLPHVKKSELIEGVVYVASPVRNDIHGEPHAELMIWLGHYAAETPGVKVADNTTVRLDLDNEPQPDALLRIVAGGQSRQDDDGYVAGPPELVAEVAASSASYDLHDKMHVYQRSGVREYIVWRTVDRRIDWFELADDAYRPLVPDTREGLIKTFPRAAQGRAARFDGVSH